MVNTESVATRFLIYTNYNENKAVCVRRGKYDYVHGIFGRDFSTSHRDVGEFWYEVEVSLERFGNYRYLSGEIAKRNLIDDGLCPAEFSDLLVFGAKYPEYQRFSKIVCLGSTQEYNGKILVPCLTGNSYRRGLIAEPINTIFYNCRFLAVLSEKKCDQYVYL